MNGHQAIVVTGGSTGIGAAICRRFLEQGLTVINLARRPLDEHNPRLHNVTLDLSDRAATRETAQELGERFPVTGLIHNAGLIRANLLGEVDLQDLDYLTEVHIAAAITLTQAILPGMRERQFGRIVLITSRAALGLETRTSYTATKAGMMGMARTWALELGKHGITVNTVAPGPIQDTEMFAGAVPEERTAAIAAGIPVRRLGKSSDVASAVAFLASPEAGFITGQTLMVCGGASLGSLSL